MIDRLKGECNMQTPGHTIHGQPNDEGSDSWSIGNDSSRLRGSGSKRKMIAQGYKTRGLKGMDKENQLEKG